MKNLDKWLWVWFMHYGNSYCDICIRNLKCWVRLDHGWLLRWVFEFNLEHHFLTSSRRHWGSALLVGYLWAHVSWHTSGYRVVRFDSPPKSQIPGHESWGLNLWKIARFIVRLKILWKWLKTFLVKLFSEPIFSKNVSKCFF